MLTQIMKILKNQKIINFSGMEFCREKHPSARLRQRSATYRIRQGASANVAKNVRGIFQNLLGF